MIGAFNPFTFKVIIGKYLFIAILSLCTCFPLSLFLHLFKAVLLTSLAMFVWWRCIILAFFFFLSGKFLILPFILNDSLAG